jgi:2-polyprenyl-3-methyl-5-hydroxy-6-metoxy-1,4-benzoquinol methylase
LHLDTFQQGVLDHGASVAPCNYLEIGAGGGLLLRRFRDLGFRCYGVDPAQWVDDDSIVSDLSEIPGDMRFGVIILADVLEHLVDPLALMERLRGLAESQATLFCSFPCKDSRPARRYKGKWSMVRPYGHLHYFSCESARTMLSRAGWQITSVRLARTIPIKVTLAKCDMKTLLYEIVKGGRDQMYVTANAGQSPAN